MNRDDETTAEEEDLIENLFASVRQALVEESQSSFSNAINADGASCCIEGGVLASHISNVEGAGVTSATTNACVAPGVNTTSFTTSRLDGTVGMVASGYGEVEPGGDGLFEFGLGLCAKDQAVLNAVLGRERRGAASAIAAGKGEKSLLSDDHAKILKRTIEKNAGETLRDLRERRRRAGLARTAGLTHLASRRATFSHLAEGRLAQARAQGLVKTRRLLLRGADAARRLQELLHECLGEYEKARLRGARRRRLSVEACDSVIAGKILDLRWSRFCSRLEADALGLVKAHDLGNPTEPARHAATHGRSGVYSATAASFLASLLARAGLSDSRIVRVVALCPCTIGGVVDNGNAAGGGGSDRRLRNVNLAQGFGRAHADRRGGAGGAVTGGIEAALREEGVGAAAMPVVAKRSPLGVADVIRKAVLCGNDGLMAALSCSDSTTGIGAGCRRHSASRGADERKDGRTSAVAGLRTLSVPCVGPSGGGKEVGGSKGSRRGGNDARGSLANEDKGAPQASHHDGERCCTVVGAAPDLLLSSSHILWTLQPPFGVIDDVRLLGGRTARGGCCGNNHGDEAVDGNGGSDGGGSDAPQAIGDAAAEWPDAAKRARVDREGWKGERANVGGDGHGRREGIARDVAWVGAAPVGSRVYYCLEEAEWEALRRETPRRSTRQFSTRFSVDDAAADGQRKGQASGAVLLPDDSGAAGVLSRKGGVKNGTNEKTQRHPRGKSQAGTADAGSNSSKQHAAATVFARSVSKMLAEVYLAPSRGCCKGIRLREGEVEDGLNGNVEAGQGADSAQRCRSWESLAVGGDRRSADIGTSAASFVVCGTADVHRSCSGLNTDVEHAGEEEERHLEGLSAVPDVLVGARTAAPKAGRRRERTITDFSPASRDSTSGVHELHRDRGAVKPNDGATGNPIAEATPATTAGLFHFAPAGVQQLLGTPLCREFVEALPPEERARVFSLYNGFPARTPPVGHLYVPLALPSAAAPPLSIPRSSSWPAETERSEEKDRLLAGLADGVSGSRLAVGVVATSDKGDDALYLGSGTAGSAPSPLLGALVHPLPMRAVRELLQVYLATTRAVGTVANLDAEVGVGVFRRRRTSGLFMPQQPPLPPFLLDRDQTDVAAVGNTSSDGVGGGGGPNDDYTRCRGRSSGELSGWEAVPILCGEKEPSLSEDGSGRLLPEAVNARGDDDGARWTGFCAAATPPSAVDVLPDAPNLVVEGNEDRVVSPSLFSLQPISDVLVLDVGPNAGPYGRELKRPVSRRHRGGHRVAAGIDSTGKADAERIAVEGTRRLRSSAEANSGGVGRRSPPRAAVPAPAERPDASIASSLCARFRHTYVAVLAPSPVPPLLLSTAGNAAKPGGAGIKPGPFWGSSSLLLQVETPVRGPPGWHRDAGGGGADGGARVNRELVLSGGGGREEVAVEKKGVGGGEARGMPPRLCGWRACIADAVAGPLCSVHVQLKDFLDGRAATRGGVSDAIRFLPPGSGAKRRSSARKRRSATNATASSSSGVAIGAVSAAAARVDAGMDLAAGRGDEGELAAVRSASPLLLELFNGKLGTTIEMFCRRAVAETKTRQRGRHDRQRPDGKQGIDLDYGVKHHRGATGAASSRVADKMRQVPERVRWADPEEERVADRKLDAEIRWAEQVLQAEKEVTLELRRLTNHGVYPEAELAQIRREHGTLASEWRQAKNLKGVGGGRGYGTGEENDDEHVVLAGKKPPSNGYIWAVVSDNNSGTRKDVPPLARAATVTMAVSTSSAFTKSVASSVGMSETVGSAPEGNRGARRRERKGALMPAVSGGGGRGGNRDRSGVGREGLGDRGGGPAGVGARARSEEEMELEFSRLKRELFRRRRHEVEKSKMVSIGHVQGLGPLKPSLDKPTPVAEAQSTSVVRGSGPPNSIGSRPLGSRDGGGGGGDGDLNGVFAAASLSGSSSFPAAPAELHHHYHHHHHQLSPISTLLTRPGRHNKQPLQSQRQQQQQLNKRMPQQLSSSHAPSSSSSSPPLHSHHQRGPLVSSAPKEEDNQSPQHHTGVPPTATAPPPAASLVRPPRRRHSFPPNGSASGEGPAPAPPPGPAGRAARVVMGSPGLERDRSKGGRGKGGGSGGGGGGGMLASRRRVSIKDGGVGVLQVHPLVSRGGGGRGFDAAPYQTKVLFRDR